MKDKVDIGGEERGDEFDQNVQYTCKKFSNNKNIYVSTY